MEEKSEASKRSKNNRRKGHDLERFVARWFREHGFEAERNLEYARGTGIDVIAWKDDRALPYVIQCKLGSRVPDILYRWLDEIQNSPNETPMLVVRRDRKKALVVMELDQFEKFL